MVPVLDTLLAQLPAELDELAIPIGREVDQTLQRSLELDADSVEARHRLEKLQLGAARRVARLLIPVAIVGTRAGAFRLVLRDAGLILQLGQQGRQLRDLGDDPSDARQVAVRLFDGVCAEPFHGSTIYQQNCRMNVSEAMDAEE